MFFPSDFPFGFRLSASDFRLFRLPLEKIKRQTKNEEQLQKDSFCSFGQKMFYVARCKRCYIYIFKICHRTISTVAILYSIAAGPLSTQERNRKHLCTSMVILSNFSLIFVKRSPVLFGSVTFSSLFFFWNISWCLRLTRL